ncbi:MAG: NADPH:quinone oxidoreductase family protein [Gaiellales bacterium]
MIAGPPLVVDAWQVDAFGEPSAVLRRGEVRIEDVPPGSVLVEVEAIGLNFLDVSVCRGEYTSEPVPPVIPGAEVAGRVVALGDGVTAVSVGDRVSALSPSAQGGFAGAVVLPESAVCRIPDDLPLETAAAILVTYHTAHVSLVRRAGLRVGEWVLIHAGAGGTGSAAVQIAVAQGARVITTSRSDEKAEVCRSLGAEVALNTRRDDFVAAALEATGGRGVDVVLDPVGGEGFRRSLECIAFEGRILPVGWASGVKPELGLVDLLVRNITAIGVAWGMAYPPRAPEVVQETHRAILAGVASGALRPLVRRTWSFAEIPTAVQALADGGIIGKGVVLLDEPSSA